MTRLGWALGVCIALAGCSASSQPAQDRPSLDSPTQAAVATPGTRPSTSGATPVASEPVAAEGLVAYGSDGAIWIANVDGTGAHELIRNVPDGEPLAWSADGSRLLYRQGLRYGLTDTAGSQPVEIELRCPPVANADAELASCEAHGGVSLSPDGTRLAYAISEGSFVQGSSVTSSLAVLDLATGRVTKVGSTDATISGTCGETRSPRWSPDGRRIAFVRTTGPVDDLDCPEALLTVNVDGTDARQVLAPRQLTGDLQANWAPDSSRIVVDGFVGHLGSERPFGGDIYIVRSDGTAFRALTGDRLSDSPSWTRDGRIAFTRWAGHASADRGDLWVMDADGGNATLLEATVPALTAAGCVTCMYPVYHDGIDLLEVRQSPPLERFWRMMMIWQPQPMSQP